MKAFELYCERYGEPVDDEAFAYMSACEELDAPRFGGTAAATADEAIEGLWRSEMFPHTSDYLIGLKLKRKRRRKKKDDDDDDEKKKKDDDEEDDDKKKKKKKDEGDDDDDDETPEEKTKKKLAKSGALTGNVLRAAFDAMSQSELLGKIEFVRTFEENSIGRYHNFTAKAGAWLSGFRPEIIPESWWNIILGELLFRANNFVFPLGATDIRLWYEWLTVWITGEVAEKLREHDQKLATVFVEDFEKFALAWGPAIETMLKGNSKLILKVGKKLLIELCKIIVLIVKTAIFFVIDIIIRVLKCIPYTFWLGYILGYVFAFVQSAVDTVL